MKIFLPVIMLGVLVACGDATEELLQNDLVDALEKRGWAPLAFPDSSYRPASIIIIDDDKRVEWLGTLDPTLCRIPDQYLQPEPQSSGKLLTEESYTASVKLAATIEGVGVDAGADSNIVSILKIEDQGPYNLDSTRLITWLRINQDAVEPACLDWFKQENTFLVYRAFAIKRGSISFKRNVGGQMEAVAPELIKKVVNVKAEAGAGWNQKGELVIDKPAYIAVRGIRGLLTGIEILGDENQDKDKNEDFAEAIKIQGKKTLRPPE